MTPTEHSQGRDNEPADATPAGRAPRRDAARNRARIIDAAREVFATQGVGAGLNEIAHHAGVGIGTIYRHFPDKEVLVGAALGDRFTVRRRGVVAGDRVVGYLPNTTHTVVAFLAAASIGAVWSACGQDYGAPGAATRFAKLEPVILFAADGYRWNGREHDRRAESDALRAALPTVRHTVRVPCLGLPVADDPHVSDWAEVTGGSEEPVFEQLPFDAPLWVLFSS
ncbi:TetR family transcriptional regulator [Streptomyces sp. NPDC002932]|uniref:TetR family transcriptional regulator n=1 Tax=Streptomyces sp. NPDC002932 TaxID=3364672 RepID=UPI0036A05C04